MGNTDLVRLLAIRTLRDARVRTVAFAYIFAGYSFVQPLGYSGAYPTLARRLEFAHTFGSNKALVLFYGKAYKLATIGGYAAWRVGGILSILAAVFGLLAAVKALRSEEEAGRTELVLAAVVSRASVLTAAFGGIALGVVLLWIAESAGLVAGGLAALPSFYMALSTVSVAAVFVAAGAVASQLAPTRRVALELGGGLVAISLLLRILADTLGGAGWLDWLTPLGWAEQTRPFTGSRPLVLLLPLVSTLALLALARGLARERDIGTGVLPARDERSPRLALLSSPVTLALRLERTTLAVWLGGIAIGAALVGGLANTVKSAGLSGSLQRQLEKYGTGSITAPRGYIGLSFVTFVLVLSLFAVAQVSAARREEAEERLETMLSLSVARRTWLGGRLALASAAAAVLSLAAALACLAAASASGASVPVGGMLGAAANCFAMSILFLGLASLLYALIPRIGAALAYGLVALAFLWQLVAPLLSVPQWVAELTPFAHIGNAPGVAFRPLAVLVLAGIGVLAAGAALAGFERRDLIAGA